MVLNNAADSKAVGGQRDIGFWMIVGLVVVVAVWLLAMPVAPGIARSTMDRFHLRGRSYFHWAIQQPIPSMYNFANRYAVYESCPPQWRGERNVSTVTPLEARYVNHFPVRMITFADARYRFLLGRTDHWYEFKSSYRGQSVASRVHVRPVGSRGLEMVRDVDPEPAR